MFFEKSIILTDVYIGDSIADPCQIFVVGNGGKCQIPHFDIEGGDLYCCMPLLMPGFLTGPTHPAKNALSFEERKIINELLKQPYKETNMTVWQYMCNEWNSLEPDNYPQIDYNEYKKSKYQPNYAKKSIWFIDDGRFTKIDKDGGYQIRR